MSHDPDTVPTTSRVPPLSVPFAIVGAAAGWLSAGLLANPLVDVAYGGKQQIAALCAGFDGAAIGAALTYIVRTQTFWSSPRRPVLWLAFLLLLGGATCGLVVGRLTGYSSYGAVTGGALGVASAVAVLPVCALVLAAATRAERARLGSIVAMSDVRAVWSILAAALAVITLAALPDWPAARAGDAREPLVAALLAVASFVAVAALVRSDAGAYRRVAREAGAPLETCAPDDAPEGAAIPRVDLGLGEDVRRRVARGAVYRSAERVLALVVGSPAEARAALGRALWRGGACLGLCAAVLAAHTAAHGGWALDVYQDARCARGDAASCRQQAQRLPASEIRRASALMRLRMLSSRATRVRWAADPGRHGDGCFGRHE